MTSEVGIRALADREAPPGGPAAALPPRTPDVSVVAYEMEGRPTGVGRYLEGLLSGVAEVGAGGCWSLFFKGNPFAHPLWKPPASAAQNVRFEAFFDRRPAARPIPWEQFRLPGLLRSHTSDLLFSPAYSLPSAPGLPAMVTLHDLSFEHLGREFSWRERWRRRLLARWAARRARRVLVDSRTMARDVAETYGVQESRIGVVPLGIDRRFFAPTTDPELAERELRRLGVEPPYLLALGSVLPRRRLDLVLAAMAAITPRRPDLRLVICGANRLRQPARLEHWINDSGVGNRVVHLGWLDDGLLPDLYRGAEASVYLSTYEGFGLPPLEALACGTLPVVSSGQAFDDLWPAYPFRVPELTAAGVAEVFRQLLVHPGDTNSCRAEGRRRVEALSWTHSARLFLREIELALVPRARPLDPGAMISPR